MSYAIVDLDDRDNNGCRVAMISKECYPFVGIEEEWLEEGEDDPSLPVLFIIDKNIING